MPHGVDHLVYATPDLGAGVARVEELLGRPLVPGGRHEGWGTRNALMDLGDGAYLEVIGPDPDAGFDGLPVLFGIDRLDGPRLVTWAVKARRLDAVVEQAGAAGVELGPVAHGARALPDGTTLTWQLTNPFADRYGGTVPFLIDWGDGAHPTDSLPDACELLTVTVEHPDPGRVADALRLVGADAPVVEGPRPRLVATIRAPAGPVELS